MEINFSSDNRIVNWKYENKSYSYVVEGIIFATESNDMIFLEIYENKTFSYRFINLNGKDILWYDENGNLKHNKVHTPSKPRNFQPIIFI